ncbi:hypothetical protein GCM10010358_81840 [Streptomyces minutiscleroticus]|uniref:BRCT domain-containing protein n=1 Tax=Streptomyces minutiscleroticus TaxID=68238 RepID=A0A918P467_9ACTN|nr:hypothetical protein GCM10010358_81840 [Streptomyces minutiscleroticus]
MTEPGATPPAPDTPATGQQAGNAGNAEDTQGGEGIAGGPPAGMTVIVTGAMTGPVEKLSRNRMNELVEQAGGRSSSSVSKKTTLVVAREDAGSKRAKAESLGIRPATPDEIAALIADHLDRGPPRSRRPRSRAQPIVWVPMTDSRRSFS